MKYTPSIVSALCAAICFALAAVLQQESTQTVSADKSLSVGLIVDLFKRPRWLVGGLFMLTGFGLQALALAYGPIAVVQPIIMTELAFAIPLGILRRHRRAGRQEWAGIWCMIVGVSVFILAADPGGGIQDQAARTGSPRSYPSVPSPS